MSRGGDHAGAELGHDLAVLEVAIHASRRCVGKIGSHLGVERPFRIGEHGLVRLGISADHRGVEPVGEDFDTGPAADLGS